MMHRPICHRCLQTFHLIFSSLIRTPLRKLLLVFYLLVLFSAKDYIIAFLKFAYFTTFVVVPELPEQPQRQLLQIHVVFKHGHRSPFRLYKTDPNPKSIWPEGLGQVTALGRLQMYVTGTHLRQKYKDFLSYDPNEVSFMSSDAVRCLTSAYSLLTGLYPPDEEWAFGGDLRWQPITVSYIPLAQDMYLASNPNCPKYEALKDLAVASEESHSVIHQFKSFYEYWNSHSGKSVSGFDSAGDLYKTLSVENDNNYTVPDWALTYWDELVLQADISYYFHFKTKLMQRLKAGPILDIILHRMKERIAGRDDIKVYGYSGHGSNIAAIQCALQAYDKHTPHGAAQVFELYREGNGSHTIRFVYFNSSHPERQMEKPYVILLQGTMEHCPIEYFENYIQDLVPENWEEECKDTKNFTGDFTPEQHPEYLIQAKE